MARKIEIDSWIDKKDPGVTTNKSKWIVEQLKKNDSQLQFNWSSMYEVSDDELKNKLHNLVNSGHGGVVKEIKAAWSREKYRAKNKSNTFALSKSAHKQLRFLVNENKSSIKQTLEDLILNNYSATREAKVKEKEALQRLKSSQTFLPNFSLKPEKVLEKDHTKTKKRLKLLDSIAKEQLLRIFEYQVFLEDMVLELELEKYENLLGKELRLTDKQTKEVSERFEEHQKHNGI